MNSLSSIGKVEDMKLSPEIQPPVGTKSSLWYEKVGPE